MKTRKAKKEDIKEIDRIYCEGVLDEVKLQFPKKTKKEIIGDLDKHKRDRINGFNRDINSKLNFWVVVEENKSIIAFGQAEINKDDKKKAAIEKIYVSKKHRKKGIASNIVKKLINWLKERDVESISSGIFIKNIPSIKIHEKFGFEVTAIRMQKKLKK